MLPSTVFGAASESVLGGPYPDNSAAVLGCSCGNVIDLLELVIYAILSSYNWVQSDHLVGAVAAVGEGSVGAGRGAVGLGMIHAIAASEAQ